MTFQPGANLYTQGFGSRAENIEVPHLDVRAPTTTDINYPIGKWWLFTGNSLWYLLSQSSGVNGTVSNWIQVAAGGALALAGPLTITNGSLTLTNGNLVLGTAGNKLIIPAATNTTAAGANAAGTVTLVAGTATVATTAVTANSIILLSRQSIGASTALGELTVGTVVAGTATPGTPATPLVGDLSVVGWEIIN